MFSVPHILGDSVPTRNANRLSEVLAAFTETERDLQTAINNLGEFRGLLNAERVSILDSVLEPGRGSILAQNIGDRLSTAQRRMNDASEEMLRIMALAAGFESEV